MRWLEEKIRIGKLEQRVGQYAELSSAANLVGLAGSDAHEL